MARGRARCYHRSMNFRFPKLVICCVVAAVCACSPKFDWRDYRGSKAPYAVLFPGKPATHTRQVNLDGQNADMTMAAVNIDGTLFAVGSAELPDPDKAQLAVQAMKKAMVRNIGAASAIEATRDGAFTVEAKGSSQWRADDLERPVHCARRAGLPGRRRRAGQWGGQGRCHYLPAILQAQLSVAPHNLLSTSRDIVKPLKQQSQEAPC